MVCFCFLLPSQIEQQVPALGGAYSCTRGVTCRPMQFETSSSHVCVCVCVSLCLSRVGGCVFICASGGEVAVKSVLFSPVGRICSLQICTACYCNRSHGCCSRCRRLQRRVRTWSRESPPRRPSPLPKRHLVPGAACRPGLLLVASHAKSRGTASFDPSLPLCHPQLPSPSERRFRNFSEYCI